MRSQSIDNRNNRDSRKAGKQERTLSDWTAGYVSDIDYTYGYFHELNPLLVHTAMLHASVCSPNIETACELGFGQGLSTNFHAATSDAEWYGTDFNPAQAGFARELAAATGSNAKLFDESFADFCCRDDLPNFDFISLHGIWSWISDDNRKIIVDFVRRKLNVGGVLYISYNTLPGWAAFAPMRHLLTQHAEIIGSEGKGIVSRIDGALEFANRLLANDPLFTKANPGIAQRVEKLSEQNRHYLAHEYFNKDWDPMHFLTCAQWLASAKLDFSCSANILDHFDLVNMSKKQTSFLAEIPDVMLRQSTRDFMVNQQFRKDLWVKGMRRLPSLQAHELMQAKKFVLTMPREEVPLVVTGSRGEVSMNEEIYNPVLDTLADYSSVSMGELIKRLSSQQIGFLQIVEALMILTSTGKVAPVQDLETASSHKQRTDKLNAHLIRRARSSGEITHLVSPLTGGGIGLSRFEQLFVGAVGTGASKSEELAQAVWNLLALQNQRLVKDGSTLESEEENVAELTRQATEFLQKKLPVLKATLVV